MKRKKETKTVRLAVLLGILSALLVERYSSPEPDTIIFDPPKQPHHVIYIHACGVLEGILLTTDPIQFADAYRHMTPEMIQLEQEALVADRAFRFVAGLWVMCDGDPFPENLDVIERDET